MLQRAWSPLSSSFQPPCPWGYLTFRPLGNSISKQSLWVLTDVTLNYLKAVSLRMSLSQAPKAPHVSEAPSHSEMGGKKTAEPHLSATGPGVRVCRWTCKTDAGSGPMWERAGDITWAVSVGTHILPISGIIFRSIASRGQTGVHGTLLLNN